MKTLLITAALFLGMAGKAQQHDSLELFNYERDCIRTTYWGIILSTKDYKTAKNFAESAAKKLNMEFSNRGYVYSELEMLADTTECGCGELHGYIPRGRYDDGEYVSIEIKNDYYVVVAISGDKDSTEFQNSLSNAKVISKDAYVLPQEVWMCCMH